MLFEINIFLFIRVPSFISYDKWDNKFFGISDSEAGWMDPQQCLALEVTYSALEDGGFTREQIKGSNTGVYIGYDLL